MQSPTGSQHWWVPKGPTVGPELLHVSSNDLHDGTWRYQIREWMRCWGQAAVQGDLERLEIGVANFGTCRWMALPQTVDSHLIPKDAVHKQLSPKILAVSSVKALPTQAQHCWSYISGFESLNTFEYLKLSPLARVPLVSVGRFKRKQSNKAHPSITNEF